MSHPAPNPVPEKPPFGLYGGNVLFAAPMRWDEACFAAPALRALRSVRPTCTLGVICEEHQLEFWKTISGVNHFITYDKKSSVKKTIQSSNQSRITWESAILWEKGFASDFAYAAKIKQRLGYSKKNLVKYLTDQTSEVENFAKPQHRVKYYLDFMEKLNILTNQPKFFLPSVSLNEPKKTTVIVNPESDFGSHHEWPLDQWREILPYLSEEKKLNIVIVQSTKNSSQLSKKILLTQNTSINAIALNSLGESLAEISGHVLAITADSSFAHLSAHLGVPTITLFGPNDAQWKRPLGIKNLPIYQKVECSPCFLSQCIFDLRCQHELTTEKVKHAVDQCLKASSLG
jgi:ADP-heptose:LPS heptosyltransferase